MSGYVEKEVKVLNVNPEEVKNALLSLGAEKVFDDNRVFTTLDYDDLRLSKAGNEIRLTEEGKIKLSYDGKIAGGKETIKLVVSRKQEALDFFNRLGLNPVAEVKSHRTSFEWEGIDFDLDEFPQLAPFLEIDLGDSSLTLDGVLEKLSLKSNEVVTLSTKEIFKKFGLDYFDLFRTPGAPK
ncbi:MAG: CYTH domain-containing protein [Patescibacteria group bacterium]